MFEFELLDCFSGGLDLLVNVLKQLLQVSLMSVHLSLHLRVDSGKLLSEVLAPDEGVSRRVQFPQRTEETASSVTPVHTLNLCRTVLAVVGFCLCEVLGVIGLFPADWTHLLPCVLFKAAQAALVEEMGAAEYNGDSFAQHFLADRTQAFVFMSSAGLLLYGFPLHWVKGRRRLFHESQSLCEGQLSYVVLLLPLNLSD